MMDAITHVFSALTLKGSFAPLLAGASTPAIIAEIGYCLIFAAVLCAISVRIKVPVIAAFLCAGVAIGPIGIGLVTSPENIDAIASLGLILLLFVIGLEINFKKLMASGKPLIVTGLLQFPLCIGFGFVITMGLEASGWEMLSEGYIPLYAGFTAAASSTLLVVKLLQERFQMDTIPGRIGIGLLIFQDIWAIVVLAVQPSFDSPQISTVGLTFLGTGIVALTAAVAARYLLPTIFKWIAKLPELMLVVALGWCFGVATFGEHLEAALAAIGVSLHHVNVASGMGALIAGASIASYPYAHEVVAKVGVVRDFFVTLFFVALGMSIPVPDSMEVILLAVVLAGIAILARYFVFFPLMHFTGLDRRNSFVTSTKLAQISEFCLVIAYLGKSYDHIGSGTVSAVIFAFVITALITPSLFGAGDALHEKLGGLLTKLGFKAPQGATEAHDGDHPPIVMLGFHSIASSMFYEIAESRPHMMDKIAVIDINVAVHPKINATGAHAHYGDISNVDVLMHHGVDHASVIISTIPDDVLRGTTNAQIVRMLRGVNPHAYIIACGISAANAVKAYEAGASYVFLPRIETARAVLPAIDAALGDDLANWVADHHANAESLGKRHEILR